jgi:hypothetical protein
VPPNLGGPVNEQAPEEIWAVVHEGKMLGAYDHDDTVSGASAVARAVPGSIVVRYVRAR